MAVGCSPTEAEWNYAWAAGGVAQRIFPWGAGSDCTVASCSMTTFSRVGSFPNGDGLYGQADLAGSVYNWVQDWFAQPYLNPCDNCANLIASSSRAMRGGTPFGTFNSTEYRFDQNPSLRDFSCRGPLRQNLDSSELCFI